MSKLMDRLGNANDTSPHFELITITPSVQCATHRQTAGTARSTASKLTFLGLCIKYLNHSSFSKISIKDLGHPVC